MSDEAHKDLIQFAFSEFAKAIQDAKSGISPTGSYDKLKQVYDTLSAAEKRREKEEITDQEMQATLAEQVEKLKGE